MQLAQKSSGGQRRWHSLSLAGMMAPVGGPGFAACQAGSQLHSERARQRRLLAAAAAEPCLAAPTEQGADGLPACQALDPLPALLRRGVRAKRGPEQQTGRREVPASGAAAASPHTTVPLPPHDAAAAAPASLLPPQWQADAVVLGSSASSAAGLGGAQPGEEPLRLPVPNLGYTCLNIQLQQQRGIRTNR